MMPVAHNPNAKAEADPVAGLKTEWNKKGVLVAHDGTVIITINLPPICPTELTVNNTTFRSATDDQSDPMVFHEVAE